MKCIFSLLALMCMSIFASSSVATTIMYKTFSQVVQESQHAIGGVIDRIESEKYADGLVYSTLVIEDGYVIQEESLEYLDKPIKIRYLGGSVEVISENGVVGIETHNIEGTPRFQKNEEVVLFVSNNGKARVPFFGYGLGVFKVEVDGSVKNAIGDDVIGVSGGDVISRDSEGKLFYGSRAVGGDNGQASKKAKLLYSINGADFVHDDAAITHLPEFSPLSVYKNSASTINKDLLISIIQEKMSQEGGVGNVSGYKDLTDLDPIVGVTSNRTSSVSE